VWQQIWFGRIYVFLTALVAGEGGEVHVANNAQFDTYLPREVAVPSLGPNNPTKNKMSTEKSSFLVPAKLHV
jgi:hypothetical protein